MYELVIDVSKWDGNVDFNSWKSRRGLWGVIIKAGGNEGGRYKDAWFEQNYSKAKAAGLHIGAYYYTVTTDVATAKGDAEHFAGLLSGKTFDLPVYMDVEDRRQFALSRRALTDVIKAFCDTLNNKGYYSGLYTGGSAWLNNMYSSELNKYANWIAWWRRNWPSEAGDIGLWQQGGIRLSDGNIVYDDVSGYTDCNWCVIDYPSKINGKSTPTPTPTPTPQPSTKLDEDGWIGELSVSEWQKQIGSPYVDGIISGQHTGNRAHMERFVSVSWEGNGQSVLAKAVQKRVGATQDGLIGPNTVKCLQAYLNQIGKYGLSVDGYFGPLSATALQNSLNKELWK